MFTACFPVGVTRRFTALEHCGVSLFSMFPRQSSRSGPSRFSLSAMSLLIKVSELPSSRIANVVFGPGQLGNKPLYHWVRESWWLPRTAGRSPESAGAEFVGPD